MNTVAKQNEMHVARSALIEAGVVILCETNNYLLVSNAHGVTERIGNTSADILDYVWA